MRGGREGNMAHTCENMRNRAQNRGRSRKSEGGGLSICVAVKQLLLLRRARNNF